MIMEFKKPQPLYIPTPEERVELLEKFIRKNPGIKASTLRMAVQAKNYDSSVFGADLAKLKNKKIGLVITRPRKAGQETNYAIDDSKKGVIPDPVKALLEKEEYLKQGKEVANSDFFKRLVNEGAKPIAQITNVEIKGNELHYEGHTIEKTKKEKKKVEMIDHPTPTAMVMDNGGIVDFEATERLQKKIEATAEKRLENAIQGGKEEKEGYGKLKLPEYQVGDTCYIIYDQCIVKNYIVGVMPVTTKKEQGINMSDLIEYYRYVITPVPESMPDSYLDFLPDTFIKGDASRELLSQNVYFHEADEIYRTKEDLRKYITSLP